MPLYDVPITITYLDTVEVEAESPEEAVRAALQDQWTSISHDIDPLIEVSGEPTLVEGA